MATLSKLESDARDLLVPLSGDVDVNVRLVSQVFVAMWSSSLSARKVARLVYAMHDLDGCFTPALNKLCKAGILRQRKIKGEAHYEINFK